MSFISRDSGVAPFVFPIDVSSGNVNPPGNCIGFSVEGTGVVAFTSKGVTVNQEVPDYGVYSCSVDQFLNAGTTATGILAYYV